MDAKHASMEKEKESLSKSDTVTLKSRELYHVILGDRRKFAGTE